MKKFFYIVLFFLLLPLSGWSWEGDIFYAKTEEGVELEFEVTNEDNKTCKVRKLWEYAASHLTIPSEANGYTVTAIAEWAFEGRMINQITIPATVMSIGVGAFHCWFEEIISFIEYPFDLEDDVFEGVYTDDNYEILAELRVPKGSSGRYKAANGWKSFNSIKEMLKEGDIFTAFTAEGIEMTFRVISDKENTCEVYSENGYAIPIETEGVVTIPESAQGFTVIGIGDDAFRYGFFPEPKITQIVIPETVFYIGLNFCRYCFSLKKVVIPKSVTNIAPIPFYNCSGIESIEVDEENPVYDSREDCNAIIETEKNLMYVGCKNSFIPSSVTELKSFLFQDIPIEQVTIPEGIAYVPEYCFNWSGLKSVSLPESLNAIYPEAFSSTPLESIHIPKNVNVIYYNAFNNCRYLESISVAEDNPVYDSRENCNAIIYTEDDRLRLGCKNTIIPEGVKIIGSNAFDLFITEPTSLNIPKSIIEINSNAFNVSGVVKYLEAINCLIEEPFTIDETAFCSDIYKNTTLYVPNGTKAKYEATDGWKLFNRIVELDADGNIPTSIEAVRSQEDCHYYSPEGIRVEHPQKGGLYIRNGKKVILH